MLLWSKVLSLLTKDDEITCPKVIAVWPNIITKSVQPQVEFFQKNTEQGYVFN
jgi:hypothetical protein